MFQEFVKTLKETGIDKISSSQEVESCIASVKHKTFNALDRFKPKEKKQEKG